jgi:transcriptional regulator with XRE-family HTH domain
MIPIGKVIAHIRKSKGISQRDASYLFGISPVYLCNIEKGHAVPSPELLECIGETLGVDVYVVAWCLYGDVNKLPKAVRGPAERLTKAWRFELGL